MPGEHARVGWLTRHGCRANTGLRPSVSEPSGPKVTADVSAAVRLLVERTAACGVQWLRRRRRRR